jgi:multidrug efflux pump subunit AcrB
MRMNVSAWAIRQPIPSLVLFLILMVLGLMAFRSLPVERFPNIDIPLVSVTITQSGASPSELETQVARKVEDAIASITGVRHMSTVLTDGVATTNVEFELETNTDRALNDVKDAIARIRSDLPRTIDEPIVQRIEIAGLPILTYAVAAPQKTLEELSWFIDDTVDKELKSVRGVAEVRRVGGVKREIRVSLDPYRLLALGITAGDVNAQLRAVNTDLAGGRSEIGGAEQTIRTLGGAPRQR